MTGHHISLPAILLATTMLADAAGAATFSEIVFRDGGLGVNPCGTAGTATYTTGPGLLDKTFATGAGTCQAAIAAYAGAGGVGVLGTMGATPGPNGTVSAVSVAATSAIDVYIIVPIGFSGGDIPVSVNTHLDGSVSATLDPLGSAFRRNIGATLVATLNVSGQTMTGLSRSSTLVRSASATATDLISGDAENLPEAGASSVINIDPTRPVEVRFKFDGRVSHGLYGDSGGAAAFDALSSFSFALTGPALNLPDGFSAYSPGGEIVGNRFVPTAVPEPAIACLWLLGLGGLCLAACRRASPVPPAG